MSCSSIAHVYRAHCLEHRFENGSTQLDGDVLAFFCRPPASSPVFDSESQTRAIKVEACELAIARAAKVLAARAESHASLEMNEFFHTSSSAYAFSKAVENVAGQTLSPLRSVLATQAKAFLTTTHAHHLQTSARQVEEEQWIQCEVPQDLQQQITKLVTRVVGANGSAHPQDKTDELKSSTETMFKTLHIAANDFFVVKATVNTLQMLFDYLELISRFDTIRMEIMTKIIEYLKVNLFFLPAVSAMHDGYADH